MPRREIQRGYPAAQQPKIGAGTRNRTPDLLITSLCNNLINHQLEEIIFIKHPHKTPVLSVFQWNFFMYLRIGQLVFSRGVDYVRCADKY